MGVTEDAEMGLPERPSLAFRAGSAFIVGATGFLCRTFLIGLNRLELNGYDKFQKLLDERADVGSRTRGLITGKYLDLLHKHGLRCG